MKEQFISCVPLYAQEPKAQSLIHRTYKKIKWKWSLTEIDDLFQESRWWIILLFPTRRPRRFISIIHSSMASLIRNRKRNPI